MLKVILITIYGKAKCRLDFHVVAKYSPQRTAIFSCLNSIYIMSNLTTLHSVATGRDFKLITFSRGEGNLLKGHSKVYPCQNHCLSVSLAARIFITH